jgi:hypothetical protein
VRCPSGWCPPIFYLVFPLVLYRVHHKHLRAFEIWKPACQLRAAFVLTIIMHSDVWSLVEMKHWSVQQCIVAVELFIKTQSVTAIQRGFHQQFQRVMLLATKLCSCGYPNGVKKDSKLQRCPFTASKPDNVEWVSDATLQSLCRSAWQPALALHLNECSLRQILHKDLHYHPYKIQVAQELSAWDKSSELFPGRLISCFGDITWPAALPCSNRLHPLGLGYKQVTRNMSCQYWWLKTPNSGMYSKNPHGNAKRYDSLSITTTGVYWMTWWAPSKRHIQTIMIEMISHGHGMHPIVLIKFVHFSLKCYFI